MREESSGSFDVGLDGIVDVGEIDSLVFSTDPSKASPSRTGDQARNDVRVPRSPDQMRSERDRRQRFSASTPDTSLRLGLRFRVAGMVMVWIRDGLVGAFHVATVKNNTGGTREDQP